MALDFKCLEEQDHVILTCVAQRQTQQVISGAGRDVSSRTVPSPNSQVPESSLVAPPTALAFSYSFCPWGLPVCCLPFLRVSLCWAFPRPSTLATSVEIGLLLPSPACQTASLSSRHQEEGCIIQLTLTNVRKPQVLAYFTLT